MVVLLRVKSKVFWRWREPELQHFDDDVPSWAVIFAQNSKIVANFLASAVRQLLSCRRHEDGKVVRLLAWGAGRRMHMKTTWRAMTHKTFGARMVW